MINFQWKPFSEFIEAVGLKWPGIECDVMLNFSMNDLEGKQSVLVWPEDDTTFPTILVAGLSLAHDQIKGCLIREFANYLTKRSAEQAIHRPYELYYDKLVNLSLDLTDKADGIPVKFKGSFTRGIFDGNEQAPAPGV